MVFIINFLAPQRNQLTNGNVTQESVVQDHLLAGRDNSIRGDMDEDTG